MSRLAGLSGPPAPDASLRASLRRSTDGSWGIYLASEDGKRVTLWASGFDSRGEARAALAELDGLAGQESGR